MNINTLTLGHVVIHDIPRRKKASEPEFEKVVLRNSHRPA